MAAGKPSALVTGSSRGLGAATARALSGAGYAVTLHGRDSHSLAAVSETLGDNDQRSVLGDLADPDVAAQLVADHITAFGGLDVLVVNAAMASPAWIADLSAAAIEREFAVNLTSAFTLVAEALPHLCASSSAGRIVLISSITGVVPIKKLAVYSASKAALLSFNRSINLEYARRGARSTAIVPGYIDTDLAAGGHVADREQMMSADDVADIVRFVVEAPPSMVISEISVARPVAPLYEV